tara:strand:- start:3268 stop:3492 length:225 start_codon:yes stop_codon:yes gene_type:complete
MSISEYTHPSQCDEDIRIIESLSFEALQDDFDLEELPDEEFRIRQIERIEQIKEELIERLESEWLFNNHYAGMR